MDLSLPAEIKPVTQVPGGVGDFIWSGDERTIAFASDVDPRASIVRRGPGPGQRGGRLQGQGQAADRPDVPRLGFLARRQAQPCLPAPARQRRIHRPDPGRVRHPATGPGRRPGLRVLRRRRLVRLREEHRPRGGHFHQQRRLPALPAQRRGKERQRRQQGRRRQPGLFARKTATWPISPCAGPASRPTRKTSSSTT